MPELNPSPKFPISEKPHLSPNPKFEDSIVDGGRGTPVIVGTEPKEQAETTGGGTFDPTYLENQIRDLKAYRVTGDESDLTASDVKAIVDGQCDAVWFVADETTVGLITRKYKTGNNYFLTVLIDQTGVGLKYETVSYELIGNSLSLGKTLVQGNIQYLTTAPTQANTNGLLQIVVLDAEPATYYDGYYYIITEAGE